MPTFASIDIGSNASRLLIVEADDAKTVRKVDSFRVPVRMGHGVFLTGRLDQAAIDACIDGLKSFKKELATREIAGMRAVVTASARDAVNSDELLERAEKEAGIRLEAISGTEEARLVKLGHVEGLDPVHLMVDSADGRVQQRHKANMRTNGADG